MSKAVIHYASCSGYEREKLQEALTKAFLPVLAARGGAKGKSVMIKPNLLEWKGFEIPVCSDPAMLVELCRLLKKEGTSKIAVIENPAVRSTPVIIEKMGIAKELAELGVEVRNCEKYQFVDLNGDYAFRRIEVAMEYQEFDLVIDFAKAKTHCMMTLTLAVKNLFGLIRGSERIGWHLAVGRDYGRFADMLLDIWLLVKPHISLLDAVVGMEGNGPGSGDPVDLKFIACSDNSLALDAAVSPRLGVSNMPLLSRAQERGLIPEFEESGDVPEARALKMPDPPELELEWGVYLPPKLRQMMRKWFVAKPVVDPKRCISCGMCVKMCPPQSLVLKKGKPVFKLSKCIRCYCCQEHCPCGAITPVKTLPMRCADKLERWIKKLLRK